MSLFIESICIADGVVRHEDLHLQRMERTIREVLGVRRSWKMDELLAGISVPGTGVHKLRIVYDFKNFTSECLPYVARPVRSLRVVRDEQISYSYKWKDRSALDNLFGQRSGCDDVMIVRRGLVTDSSYANLAFFDGSVWHTPLEPLFPGVMRQYLMQKGELQASVIRPGDLHRYTRVKLINALVGTNGPVVEASQIVD